MDISLSKLPWQAQIGAFVALAIGGIAAFEYMIAADKRADIDARAGQLTSLRADIAKGQETARKLPEFKSQVAELEGRLTNLRAILPEEKDAEDLLRRLQTVAVQSNITIKNFKPEPTVTKQLHAEWPITLQLDGTYHNLALFFDRVGKFTRIVNIGNVDIKGKDKPVANSTINASCTATTFVLLEKPTAPKPGAKPDAPPAAKS
jgi:type IV pilus assembly protein PilO